MAFRERGSEVQFGRSIQTRIRPKQNKSKNKRQIERQIERQIKDKLSKNQTQNKRLLKQKIKPIFKPPNQTKPNEITTETLSNPLIYKPSGRNKQNPFICNYSTEKGINYQYFILNATDVRLYARNEMDRNDIHISYPVF